MIQMGTKLNISDNSGVKQVVCIKILGGSKKKTGKISDKIVVSIKKSIPSSKLKEGDISYGIIVRTKTTLKRKNGISINFKENAVVLITKENQLLGTRIFGVIPKEIKNKNISKIISLAKEII